MSTKQPTADMNALLKRSGSEDYDVARAAQRELAKALTLPLKQGVPNGDIAGGIFETIKFEDGAAVEFPLDWLVPGTEKDYVAYTIPDVGKLPEKAVKGDFVMVPTYDVGAAIDWSLKYARHARWDIVGRCMQVLEGMFVRKNNDDAFHVLLAAAVARNLVTYDDAATAGLFTKRLVSLMKLVMRRNAGGNTASTGRGKLTDLYLSPEAHEDIRSWDLTQVDDATRRQIFLAGDEGGLTKIFNVTLHELDELGDGQDYDDYFETDLGGTKPSDKVEIVLGLDLANRDSFVHPVRQEVQVFEDLTFHRQRRAGVYAWAEHGWSCVDGRRVLAGAL